MPKPITLDAPRRRRAKAAPGVRRFLDLATSHITRHDAHKLEQGCFPDTHRSTEHGWWLHVCLDDVTEQNERLRRDGFSQALIDLFAYARKQDCWWICLDADAEELEGFPRFDW